eukprot:TRINITY_DN15412_c0_g1_i2.p2 TRINITY_DN15412_c0_g1~~TRINITY_DN15412_c0_g1_i2.p2  ORF type:complete len:107 (-),score=17.88 TRINITY_DN15412_c0_g1_i2:299-619(-)
MGKKERRCEKTLVCVIQALIGMQVVVEMRNDVTVRGHMEYCDDQMNVTLKDATCEDVMGRETKMPLIFVRSRNIRFVHIPSSLDVSVAVEQRRTKLDNAEVAYQPG